jgi:hypothetical protein
VATSIFPYHKAAVFDGPEFSADSNSVGDRILYDTVLPFNMDPGSSVTTLYSLFGLQKHLKFNINIFVWKFANWILKNIILVIKISTTLHVFKQHAEIKGAFGVGIQIPVHEDDTTKEAAFC